MIDECKEVTRRCQGYWFDTFFSLTKNAPLSKYFKETMNRPFHATKFRTHFNARTIPRHPKIDELKKWCADFHRSGLTPLHKHGACGNLSFRLSDGEIPFVITASGASFHETPQDDFFVKVDHCDMENMVVYAEGTREPSSESLFHFAVYRERKDVNAVFHGHHKLLLLKGPQIGLKETTREEPYGTVELVDSILEVLNQENFLLLKNHGFISLGRTMEEAGELALLMLKRVSPGISEAGKS